MDERRNFFQTPSQIKVKSCYSATDVEAELAPRLGEPGSYPFTRGIHESMYRTRFWTMRQYAGFGSAKESNERYRYLLAQGTTGLSVAFDLPTQMGKDSDHHLSNGEVGRVGVAISSLDDMEALLAGIPLDKVSVSMTINATAPILLALLLVVAEKQGVPWNVLNGTTQNDILKEYIARGTYIYPPPAALKLAVDLCEFCFHHVPKWNTVSISGYHIREAGSTAVEEVAFTLADGITYVKALIERGRAVDDFAPRLAFFFNSHSYLLEEVAKFRAARRLWARIMKERFGAKNPRSCMLRFHTQTAGSSLTAHQPLNNVVRTSLQGLAAVLGGTQSLHTNAYDEALGLPTKESATLALRTQQIIAEESGLADVVDPLAGSYFVEHLTDQIEQQAYKKIEYIDSIGGMLSAIEQGYPQTEIERSSYHFQQRVENREQCIVGVNCYAEASETEVPVLKIEQHIEDDQSARVRSLKATRSKEPVQTALKNLDQSARAGRNVMPDIVNAVRAYATLGEISDCLRLVFGEYRGQC